MIKYDVNSVSNFKLFGFATGSYNCKCFECNAEFIGDKRSIQCLECAIKLAQNLDNRLADIQSAFKL